MKFDPPLKSARLLRRYKRFLADISLPDGSEDTIHCPNTGSMRNCGGPGSHIWYSSSDNPRRKLAHTFELVETAAGNLACVNTARANALVAEAIGEGRIPALAGYERVRREVRAGRENSRIDFLLQGEGLADCYIEVKSVTLAAGNGLGLFPDAVSTRGSRHLRELMGLHAEGHRAVLLFCVPHTGIDRVMPAADIDPVYAMTLCEAVVSGVEVMAWQCRVSPDELVIAREVGFSLD